MKKNNKNKQKIDYNEIGVIALSICILVLIFGLCIWSAYRSDQKYKALDSTSDEYLRAKTFVFDKHRYIQFERNNVVGNTYIVHDPNCSCNEQGDVENEYLLPERFTYKGHRYILFKKRKSVDASSIVHDPDCE